MADGDDKAAREKAWWDAWWAEDYSWAGLARKRISGTGGLHGEKTLQDYWRRDPATGAVRGDAALIAAGELVDCEGILFHIVHLPPKAKSGKDLWKGDLKNDKWRLIQTLSQVRPAAGAETVVDPVYAQSMGQDGRAQFVGAVLREILPSEDAAVPAHINASRSAWLGTIRIEGGVFGPGARFTTSLFVRNANFRQTHWAGTARFAECVFAGNADFGKATFSEYVSFFQAVMLGNAEFAEAVFTKDGNFDHTTLKGSVVFDHAFDERSIQRGGIFGGDQLLGLPVRRERQLHGNHLPGTN